MKDGKTHDVIALLSLIAGIVLIMSGLWIPPAGVIDGSVLIAFGEILTFVGSVMGINIHYQHKYNNKDNNLNTNDKSST